MNRNQWIALGAVLAISVIGILVAGGRTPSPRPTDPMLLVELYLEYDAEDGRLIGHSGTDRRTTRGTHREAVLALVMSDDPPDAIYLCPARLAYGGRTAVLEQACELVFFTERWRESEPLRREARGEQDI